MKNWKSEFLISWSVLVLQIFFSAAPLFTSSTFSQLHLSPTLPFSNSTFFQLHLSLATPFSRSTVHYELHLSISIHFIGFSSTFT